MPGFTKSPASSLPPLVVLRPEPGNTATATRIAAAGRRVIQLPLFALSRCDWVPPPASDHDALLLTSANAVHCAGPALAGYAALPVYAVGAATAAAARGAGLTVVAVGTTGVDALAARGFADGIRAALHLAGRDRAGAALPGVARTITVYASDAVALAPTALAGLVGASVLVHSPRAGIRLAQMITARGRTALAAISAAAAQAAGAGWADVAVAATPDDAALVAAALSLLPPPPLAD